MAKAKFDCASLTPARACATSVRVISPTLNRSSAAPSCFLQDVNVLLAQPHDLPVTNDVHVGLDGLKKYILLGGQKALLSGLNIGLRSFGSVDGFEAPENGL